MADKYLAFSGGRITEAVATTASVGAADGGKIIALDAAGKLDESLLPTGIGADAAVVVASEALAAGDVVNIWNNAGNSRVRKADATTAGKEAHGFVKAAVNNGSSATVYFEGSNDQLSGLTAGPLYLSTTAGAVTATPPSGAGNVVQRVGVAVSSTVLNFQSSDPIVLA